ncbi:MAG: hypothetical protein GY865_00040, partial [candidate division Zixibacteria bacterium]|nr:hypothetical protein [candidate division Zixibacteria bacterium]
LAKKWVKRVEEISTSDCIRCGSCQGICPQGIEIPKVMRLYDQLICLGMSDVARHKYRLLEVNASSCDNCNECMSVCPEQFNIGAKLSEAHCILGTDVFDANLRKN